MNPTIRFLPQAVQELEEAIHWYGQITPLLGNQFASAFEAVVERIGQFPESFPICRQTARQALIPRFPYGVFYVHGASGIHILAIFHLKQDPQKLYKRV